jgi:hypothetical protein
MGRSVARTARRQGRAENQGIHYEGLNRASSRDHNNGWRQAISRGEANIGLRTSNERPDGPPLAADASVVTAVANMPEAAARFARAGPQERS